MNVDKLREQLKIDEGVKYEVYKDHLGYPTFGIGHLVVEGDEEHGAEVGTPVSEERVNSVFESDVETYISESKNNNRGFSIPLPEPARSASVSKKQFYLNLISALKLLVRPEKTTGPYSNE